jgi:glycosyltransferase involved in cell wall biosynthesis
VTDFEVFVVDDGSTDNSPAELEKFLAESGDTRFHGVRQANAGPGAARNHGVRLGNAPYVAFLDADDEWTPHHLEVCSRALDAHPEAAVAVGLWYDEPGHRSGRYVFEEFGIGEGVYRMSPETKLRELMGLMILLTPGNTVVRRELFLEYGGYREDRCRYAEDTFLYLPLALDYPTVVLDEEISGFHRDASELSGNYTKVRPVEPFLEFSEGIQARCPAELRPLLGEFLSARAMKTACVLAYWGYWREGIALRKRFEVPTSSQLPWYWKSMAVCNPIGPVAGRLLRWTKKSA